MPRIHHIGARQTSSVQTFVHDNYQLEEDNNKIMTSPPATWSQLFVDLATINNTEMDFVPVSVFCELLASKVSGGPVGGAIGQG